VSRVSAPLPSKEKSQAGSGCVRLFLLPFFGLGCFFFYLIAIQPLWNIWRARHWPSVPCRILASEVKENRGGKGRTYQAVIKYTYQVEGRPFASDRYDFFGVSSSGYTGKKKLVDRYPPGSQATCFVNPEAPDEAVIHRGPTHMLWWGLFPLPFIAIGSLAFLPARLLSGRSTKGGPIKDTTGRRRRLQEPPSDHLHTASEGAVELQASASPVGKLLGMMVVAVFWNGIVSVFVWDLWKGFQRGRPEWFLPIFLTPFVLIGFGLIAAVIHAFLNLFNPRISLMVSSSAVPLGGNLEVQWSFRGNVGRLRDLRIFLEGAERATYRRGTNTTTDEHIFAKLPLAEVKDTALIRSGSAHVAIPADVMHSFNATNNKIVWRLKVHGNIPRFPDVSEEFAFTVLPQSSMAS